MVGLSMMRPLGEPQLLYARTLERTSLVAWGLRLSFHGGMGKRSPCCARVVATRDDVKESPDGELSRPPDLLDRVGDRLRRGVVVVSASRSRPRRRCGRAHRARRAASRLGQ